MDIGRLLSENSKYSPHSGSSVLVWKNPRRHGGVVDEPKYSHRDCVG